MSFSFNIVFKGGNDSSGRLSIAPSAHTAAIFTFMFVAVCMAWEGIEVQNAGAAFVPIKKSHRNNHF